MKRHNIAVAVIVALVMLIGIALPVLASVYYSLIYVSETSGNDYDMLGITSTVNVTNLVSTGVVTSSANDTAILSSGVAIPRMLSDDKVLFASPISATSTSPFELYTGQTASIFDIIAGFGGCFYVTDNASIENSGNFSDEMQGWYDTTFNTANKTFVGKGQDYQWLVTAPEEITVSKPTYYLSYDGGNDYIHKDAACTNAGAGNTASIEGWYYKDSVNTDDTLFSFGVVGGGNDYIYGLNTSTGKITVLINDNVGGSIVNWTSTNSTAAGTWYFMTFSYDNTRTPKFRLIVNGHIWGGADTGGGGAVPTPTTYFGFGERWNGAAWGNPYAGDMDEQRFSNNRRTVAENIAIYNSGNGVPMAVDANTVSLWRFDDNGATATDAKGVNDMTVAGATWVLGGVIEMKVVAAGVTAGEHTIKVWGDSTYLHISVDGAETDNTSFTAFPNNAYPLYVSYNGTMPYVNWYRHQTGGNLTAWFEPYTYILGDNLPDRSVGNTGHIIWGSNPAGVTANVTPLIYVSTSSYVAASLLEGNVVGETSPPADLFPDNGDMSGSGVGWLYPTVRDIATLTNTPIGLFWWLIIIINALMAMGIVGRYTQHLLLLGMAGIIVLGVGVTWLVIQPIVIIVVCALLFGVLVLEKKQSY